MARSGANRGPRSGPRTTVSARSPPGLATRSAVDSSAATITAEIDAVTGTKDGERTVTLGAGPRGRRSRRASPGNQHQRCLASSSVRTQAAPRTGAQLADLADHDVARPPRGPGRPRSRDIEQDDPREDPDQRFHPPLTLSCLVQAYLPRPTHTEGSTSAPAERRPRVVLGDVATAEVPEREAVARGLGRRCRAAHLLQPPVHPLVEVREPQHLLRGAERDALGEPDEPGSRSLGAGPPLGAVRDDLAEGEERSGSCTRDRAVLEVIQAARCGRSR